MGVDRHFHVEQGHVVAALLLTEKPFLKSRALAVWVGIEP